MRRKLIAGNWKMNKDFHDTATLINELKVRLTDFKREVDIVICPPFTSLLIARTLTADSPISVAAQNMSQHDDGAYTGEVSASMLRAVGCSHVVLGHSERRQYYGETDAIVNAKIKQALKYSLTPIVCIGETLAERESGITDRVITAQTKGVLQEISSDEASKCVVAYEPVWAIGTGKTATPEQANQVHKLIRKLIGQLYSWTLAEKMTILYGGSVNDKNARDLLSESDIDGALVGGASLKSDPFMKIIQAGVEVKTGG